MDPSGHATHIVSRQVTKNRPKGPLTSHQSKFGGEGGSGGQRSATPPCLADLALGPLASSFHMAFPG